MHISGGGLQCQSPARTNLLCWAVDLQRMRGVDDAYALSLYALLSVTSAF